MNFKKRLFFCLVIISVLSVPSLNAGGDEIGARGWASCVIMPADRDGTRHTLIAWIADDEYKRQLGLMNVRRLNEGEGVLFVFPAQEYLSFWMKNTYIPLSIAFLDTDGNILRILDMKPLDVSVTYPSGKPARFALEVNRGWFARRGIKAGCRIDLRGCLGK